MTRRTLIMASTAAVPLRAGDLVRVVPRETGAVLANPGMGWETFQRTARQDADRPSWIPSTVRYMRMSWGRTEPRRGEIDEAFLDGLLKETHDAGQTLAFRVMPCYPGGRLSPAWLRDIGGRIVRTQREDTEVPDLDDPKVLSAHLSFLERLGARYDGNPDIDHIDIGSVGWWGEWHMAGAGSIDMPSAETQKRVVDAYLAAFRKTRLLALIGGKGALMFRYAITHGAGWRADCLGRASLMSYYLKKLAEDNAADAWQNAPLAWEACPDMRDRMRAGDSLKSVLNYGLALHGSYINTVNVPPPESRRPEWEAFLRRLGYRLVLKELRHASEVKAHGKIEFAMKWQNTGSAPCYRPYRLAYRLSGAHGIVHVLPSAVTVNGWMPGSAESPSAEPPSGEVVDVRDAVLLPEQLRPGEYSVSIGVVAPQGGPDLPVVRLAIQDRDSDGWYPLSRISVRQ